MLAKWIEQQRLHSCRLAHRLVIDRIVADIQDLLGIDSRLSAHALIKLGCRFAMADLRTYDGVRQTLQRSQFANQTLETFVEVRSQTQNNATSGQVIEQCLRVWITAPRLRLGEMSIQKIEAARRIRRIVENSADDVPPARALAFLIRCPAVGAIELFLRFKARRKRFAISSEP